MFVNEECVFVNKVYVRVNKECVFAINFNSMFMKVVSTHLGQGLMLCNISIINLSDR